MVKLAIFDMDGTLLNTLDDLAVACNRALREFGFPEHETDDYKEYIGHGPIYLVTNALPEDSRDDETVKRVRAVFRDYYFAHASDLTRPYDGIADVLKAARDAGVNIAVYTNKPHAGAIELNEIYFPGLINMTVGFKDGVPPKPDILPAIGIMEHFGASKEETVYIGDSGVDMQTGRSLGVYTVGVSWGLRPESELRDNGADMIIGNPEELLKIIVDK